MKSGAVRAHCWKLVLAYFWSYPRSSDSLRGRRNFVLFCPVNNARFRRFPVKQISRHMNTTTSIGKLSEQNLENFYHSEIGAPYRNSYRSA